MATVEKTPPQKIALSVIQKMILRLRSPNETAMSVPPGGLKISGDRKAMPLMP